MSLAQAFKVICGVSLIVLLGAGCAAILAYDVPPIAEAGPDQTIKLGGTLTLDASKSREIDSGKLVRYKWTVVGVPKGNEAALGKVLYDGPNATYTMTWSSDASGVGVWTIELRAYDDGGNLAADEMHVIVEK